MRRNKYNAKSAVIDGIRFASKLEASRYRELKLLERAGDIEKLEVHPRFPLFVGAHHICTYEADFRYKDVRRGTTHIEDVKGVRTALFILKKKLMKACLGLEVKELRDRKRRLWKELRTTMVDEQETKPEG